METGLEVNGRPTFGEHEGVGEFIQRSHRASGFWLADWLRYGESRRDWAARLSQAVDVTGLSPKTLANVRAVGAIPKSRRRAKVEFALHVEVAGLSADEQTALLERCETEGWDRQELRHAIKHAQRETVLDGRASAMFTVDVTVQVEVESKNKTLAEDRAWEDVKQALVDEKHARVISARARPK
jgi:hypothetical protein